MKLLRLILGLRLNYSPNVFLNKWHRCNRHCHKSVLKSSQMSLSKHKSVSSTPFDSPSAATLVYAAIVAAPLLICVGFAAEKRASASPGTI